MKKITTIFSALIILFTSCNRPDITFKGSFTIAERTEFTEYITSYNKTYHCVPQKIVIEEVKKQVHFRTPSANELFPFEGTPAKMLVDLDAARMKEYLLKNRSGDFMHEVNHVCKPEKADFFKQPFTWHGYQVIGSHGLSLLLKGPVDTIESNVLEEAGANYLARPYAKRGFLDKYPSYKQLDSIFSTYVGERVAIWDITTAQKNNDVQTVVAKMLGRKREEVDSNQIMAVFDHLLAHTQREDTAFIRKSDEKMVQQMK